MKFTDKTKYPQQKENYQPAAAPLNPVPPKGGTGVPLANSSVPTARPVVEPPKVPVAAAVVTVVHPQWEHRTFTAGVSADLTVHGQDGWELAGFAILPHDPSTAVYHLKRRKQ